MSIFTKIFRLLFWAPILTWELSTGSSPVEEVPYGNGIAPSSDLFKSLWKVVIIGWAYVFFFLLVWFLSEVKHVHSFPWLWVLGFLYLFTGFAFDDYVYLYKSEQESNPRKNVQ